VNCSSGVCNLPEHASKELVYRLAYNGDVVAFKMGRRQGARRAHPAPLSILLVLLVSKAA
jgi:hypothetical protein